MSHQHEYLHAHEPGTFSTIRFFRALSDRVAACNTYPLNSDNLIIDHDEYAQIGEHDESAAPFAYLGIDHPRSRQDLLFGIEFFDTGYEISIDRQVPLFYHYYHLADDEKMAADIVFAILAALANGQVGVLCSQTDDDERVQAVEVLYRPKGRQQYQALRTYPMFSSKRQLRDREWSTFMMRGDAAIDEVQVNRAVLASWTIDGSGSDITRGVIRDLAAPLTRVEWETLRRKKQGTDSIWHRLRGVFFIQSKR